MQKARVLMITTDTTEPAAEAATETPDGLLHGEARAAAIEGMRQLLELLEAEPDLPVREFAFDFNVYPRDAGIDEDDPDNAEAVCWLGTVAGALGVDVTDTVGRIPSENTTQYRAQRPFGEHVSYQAIHITPQYRAQSAERKAKAAAAEGGAR